MSQPSLFDAPAEDHKEEIARLRAITTDADERYYNGGESPLSDAEYDRVRERLAVLEAREGVASTQKIGAPVRAGRARVRHMAPMLSLANAFDAEEHTSWWARQMRSLSLSSLGAYFVEPKIDGLSLEATYEDGRLVRAATRGDGTEGEDVSTLAHAIRGLPATLPEPFPASLAIRGEVYMPRAAFTEVNRLRAARGLDPLRTPRNAAAGTMAGQDPAVVEERGLAFLAYGAVQRSGQPVERSQQSLFRRLEAWGFSVSPDAGLALTLADAEALATKIWEARDRLPFDIDGVVLKVNDCARQAEMGHAGREPRWAVARKWAATALETTVLGITVQVGRTGALTPVAELAPVEIGGVRVARATLHNPAYVSALDVRVGDRVSVIRAGEVIPRIEGVVAAPDSERGERWVCPERCPSCGAAVACDATAAVAEYYCPAAGCPAQLARRVEHFTSRAALDIRGLGGEVALRLVESGRVGTLADLFRLDVASLATMERMGERSAAKLVRSIAAARSPRLDRLIYALGIRHVGESAARSLAARFSSLAELAAAGADALAAVDGVGAETASSIRRFFGSEDGEALLADLEYLGVRPLAPERTATSGGPLAGKRIVISGTLSAPRDEVAERLRAAGAVTSSSVSSRTDYLVAGPGAGSKLEDARRLGVAVLDEAGLEALLASG